ncbi:STAS domain-containing protein [Umezawaea tangerina]|uniref:Anti-anti-sigma factor n=1 Tax=Umezawaea tangerina TaxID=84725 RepID=A0A2T0TFN2_9PSEU|nr:STAS domain-containing protein [Umezawaea tangerina]PRY44453.1 anti-anti-sigma factor [Umezawaea tangerina]
MTSKDDLVVGVDRTPGATVVTATGELDANTARALDERLSRLDATSGVVVLDLTGITFCDSVGLACVLAAPHRGVDLRVVGSRQVARVVALAGTDTELPLFPTVAAATGRQ